MFLRHTCSIVVTILDCYRICIAFRCSICSLVYRNTLDNLAFESNDKVHTRRTLFLNLHLFKMVPVTYCGNSGTADTVDNYAVYFF